MWTTTLRLPDDVAENLETYRRQIGARSFNEAITMALREAMSARGNPPPAPNAHVSASAAIEDRE